MDSRERVQTLDAGSYDRFRVELVDAGFVSDDGGRTWTGPLAQPLRPFTKARSMTIRIRDGWPFVQPELIVEDMENLEHVNAGGVICLWPPGNGSRQWLTLDGWRDRIAEWSTRQRTGFFRIDETMDAHAYFDGRLDALARMDLGSIPADTPDGERGSVHGRWRHGEALLDLDVDRAGGQDVKGSWFYVRELVAPPRDLREFGRVLTSDRQREAFDTLLNAARGGNRRVAVLVWDTKEARNALVVLVDQDPAGGRLRRRSRGGCPGGEPRGRALEFAPSDDAVLRARAGEDAKWLSGYGVVVFGAGAIGSHAALALAETGIGTLTLVDGERLRPGNVVRHVAGSAAVGLSKPEAVRGVIKEHAPWTDVHVVTKHVWAPEELRRLTEDHDVTLDATGVAGFADQLSLLASAHDETLVTATLYRRGQVGRICRQAPGDTDLLARAGKPEYPLIPQGTEPDPVWLEAGCSAPVNQAPAVAVRAIAAVAVQVIVDALRGRAQLPDELYEVFMPLEVAPFDVAGRLPRA